MFDMLDGTAANVRSIPLKEAEQVIAAGARAALPDDPAGVEQKLSTGKSGDSRVYLTMTQLDGGRQQVRLAFHESSRTFVYEYMVDGTRVSPIASEYRDLGRSRTVRYSGQ